MRTLSLLGSLLLMAGCAGGLVTTPRNLPMRADAPQLAPAPVAEPTLVALSFSGGGLRAAAFSYGVLEGLRELPSGPRGRSLLDDVTFVTSVSGGSLTAAWLGLHGVPGLDRFRQQALEADGEAGMRWALLNPLNLPRLLAGGLNDRENLRPWLEERVFPGATLGDMVRRGRPIVWINATNAKHRTAFPFHERAFDAICSDFASYPLADAVAASMAVPVLFAPVVLKTYPEACRADMLYTLEPRPNDPYKRLRGALRRALTDFRDPQAGRYLKLIDGGLTDNLGLVSILQSRILLNTPYGPIDARDAEAARRLLFIVVDAGQGPSDPAGRWSGSPLGPTVLDVATAAADTAIESTMRMSYANFVPMTQQWQADLIAFRCSLPPERKAQLRERFPDWRCDDVRFEVTLIDFSDLGDAEDRALSDIPTRLKLEPAQLDRLIQAGQRALRQDVVVQGFSRRLLDEARR